MKNFKILTQHGFKSYKHIKRSISVNNYKLLTEDTEIKCTYNHRFLSSNNEWIECQNLKVGDIIKYRNRDTVVKKIELLNESVFVYDPVEVDNVDNSYYSNGLISHNCNVALGSQNTLINSRYLKELVEKFPLSFRESVRIYKEPEEHHVYVGVVDTSRGKGLDNSAISIIDITSYPFEQVATYYNNEISYLVYPEVVYSLAKKYNESFLLVENNDVGGHICAELNDLEYENIITPTTKTRKKYELGIRTTKSIKAIGCSSLRDLIESHKLIINDKNSIDELSHFIRVGTSYQAEKGEHDDLVMTLVLFAWLATSEYFKELTDHDVKREMFQSQIDTIYEDLLPEIYIDNGLLQETPKYEKIGNTTWEVVS